MRKRVLSWILTLAMATSLFSAMPIVATAYTGIFDTFDLGTPGAAPEGWITSGSVVVSTDVSVSPENSIKMQGASGSAVSAYKAIVSAPENTVVEADVYTGEGDAGGLSLIEASGRWQARVLFKDGEVCYSDIGHDDQQLHAMTTYSALEWHHVKIVHDHTAKTFDVHIDGALVGENIAMYTTGDPTPVKLQLSSGNDTGSRLIYFDNVRLYASDDASAPVVTGSSVWRSGASTATVRFMSDEDGICYYQITDSQTPPADVVSDGTSGGAVSADAAATVSLSGLASGEQYAHIVVKDPVGNVSDPLTIAMPCDYCYHEDFEAYPLNTYIASGDMSPLSQRNGGSGSANQKVIGDGTGKMLSLTSNYLSASDQHILLDESTLAAAETYVFEGDVYPLLAEGFQLRFSFTDGSYEGAHEAGVFFYDGKITTATKSGAVTLKDSYTASQWHHVKIVATPGTGKYAVYVDDVLLNDSLPLPSGINRLALSAGNLANGTTAYYDNLEFYLDPLFSGGSGSEEDPYLISSEEDLFFLSQLAAVGNTFAGKYFEQTRDISLTQTWVPIKDFSGIFDGNLHAVSGLIFSSHVDNIGFFASTGIGAQLKNIVLDDVQFTDGYLYAGALAGSSLHSVISGCSVHNVEIVGDSYVGGLIGYGNSTIINNCYADGMVEGGYYTGGLAGYSEYGNLTNSGTSVDIIGDNYAGGLVGYNYNGSISNSFAAGTVEGDYYVGGLAGENHWYASITSCYATGNVIGFDDGSSYFGGLVGGNVYYSNVLKSYSTGEVSGGDGVGGLAGYNGDFSTITECYTSGSVTGSEYAYPLVGYSYGTLSECYYLDRTHEDESISALTPDEMALEASFTDWDFSSTWQIGLDGTYDYPTLGLGGSIRSFSSAGGSISPEGLAWILPGDEKMYSIEPDSGYSIADIIVDGESVGTPTGFAFSNVQTSHSISAGFELQASTFGGGDGSTPELAYEISTASQLLLLARNVNTGEPYAGKNFMLTADLDLSGIDWEPIGTETDPFSGSFNGDGHVIEGLNINGEDYQYAGLFGYADGAAFENLTISGAIANTYSDAYCYAGGVAAYAKNTQFENCNNEADVSVTSSSTENIYGYAGGIVGYLNAESETDDVALVLTGCNNEGTVTASTTQTSSSADSNNYAGGIVGCFNSYFDTGAVSLSITQCTNSGSIEATAAAVETYAQGRTYAGGIIADADLGGDLDGTLTITDCLNTGAVSTDTDAYYARSAAGGIAAELVVNKDYADAVMTIEACRNSAAVTLDVVSGTGTYSWAQGYAGGIAGYAYTSADYDSTLTISNCINDATALTLNSVGYSSARSYLGGIVGSADAYSYESSESAVGTLIIKGSVNMAQITATAEQGNTGVSMHNTGCIAGGVAGYTSDIATIISCYNRGGVAALGNSNYYAGGIEGYASEIGKISSCYNTGAITSSGNSEENTGGVAGYLYDGVVSDSYWLTETAGAAVGTDSATPADASCTEKTVAELQSTAFVTALNAAADAGATLYGLSDMPTWEKAPNLATNNGYPFLSWIETHEEPSSHGGSSTPTGQQVTVSTPDGGTIVTGKLIESGNTEEITIRGTQFEKLADVNQGAMIPAPSATVTFDAKAVNAINGATSTGDVVLTIEKLDPANLTSEQQKRVGGRPVYDFTLTKGGQQISSFDGGHATISIPYTLGAGENPNQVVIYYLTSDGTLKPVKGLYAADSKCVVFKTTHFSTYAVGYNPVSFKDVIPNAWYKDAVDFISAREITSGTGDGVFSPETKLTRGQFIVLLMNAYGISPDAADEGTSNFVDAGNTYYTDYLLEAKSLGIVNGVGNNMFAPEQAITRQEMFVMLYNALEVIEELPQAYGDKQLSDFDDVNQVASWAQDAMTALTEGGVISGSNGMLNPTESTTRAEMAQMLYNLLSK